MEKKYNNLSENYDNLSEKYKILEKNYDEIMSVVEPMIIEKKVVYLDLNGKIMKIVNYQMIIKN